MDANTSVPDLQSMIPPIKGDKKDDGTDEDDDDDEDDEDEDDEEDDEQDEDKVADKEQDKQADAKVTAAEPSTPTNVKPADTNIGAFSKIAEMEAAAASIPQNLAPAHNQHSTLSRPGLMPPSMMPLAPPNMMHPKGMLPIPTAMSLPQNLATHSKEYADSDMPEG